MHRHRDKDRTAPFISNGEATSQNEQWHERREMGVRSREKQRVRGDSEKTAKIAPDYPVEKKPKKKFLNHGRDRHCEDDDHNSLLDRARSAEKLDDVLPARIASEKALRNRVGQRDQRIGRQQKNYPCAQGPNKTNLEQAR